MIYFIQIGPQRICEGRLLRRTCPPRQRLGQLQVGNPEELRLIAAIEGDKNFEAHLHSAFAHLRVRGEWFRWADEIAEWARPLLADPKETREAKAQYARDLVAGRQSTEETYLKLLRIQPPRVAA